MRIQNTRILSTGIYLPKKVMTNHDLAKIVDTSDDWIRERTGIVERRIADPKDELPTDMALKASRDALKAANLEPDDIDLILFATCFPDQPLPNSACLLQDKLGIKNKCGAIDIMAACSGFVYGLNMANPFIQTGAYKHILVVGSEFLNAHVDWQDRNTCILFGDGCGVAIVGPAEENQSSTILGSVLSADGGGKDAFHLIHGGTRSPITHEILDKRDHFMKMNGKEIFREAVRTLAENAEKCLEQAKVKPEEVDWVVPHQANKRIIEAAMNRLDIPMEKVIINIEKYGNTSAATVPVAFHESIQSGKIERGQTVLFDVFGAGLTSGATLLRY